MWLIKIFMSFQQHLLRHIWKPPLVKRDENKDIFMVIKGKILSAVRLGDISKTVEYGKEVSLTEREVAKSKDLINALRRDWVEIVYDRSTLQSSVVKQEQTKEVLKNNEEEILSLAQKLANNMCTEILKNSSLVKDIAKEVAKEMVSELKGNLIVNTADTQNVIQQQEKNINIEDNSSNIFVAFKDEESGITANINKQENVQVKKDDLTTSIEKMAKFRQNKAKNDK